MVMIVVWIITVVRAIRSFAVIISLYLDLHGLIFETSIMTMAGSTWLVLLETKQ